MKVKVLKIQQDLFLDLFRNGINKPYEVIEGIPRDAIIIDVWHNGFERRIEILLRSDEFEVVPEGKIYPDLIPTLKMISDVKSKPKE
jgi:hypothetical protein